MEKSDVIDNEHLRLLSLGYLIDGCITIAFSCLFIFHFVFLYYISGNPDFWAMHDHQLQIEPQAEAMRVFAHIIGTFIVLGIAYGAAKICSSRFIKHRKYRMFSYVVGMPGLLFLPYGTILGIATIAVLGRQSVVDQYDA